MTAVDWPAVRARLLALLERDPEQGATAPPLSEQQVVEAEAELGASFPSDYRCYLRQVSAGGWFLDELRRTGHGWGWGDNRRGDLTRPFPGASNGPGPGAAPPPGGWTARERDRVAGLAFIADRGSGTAVGLALTGPWRGTVWKDSRPACGGIHPLLTEDGPEATFAEWLLDWLAHMEELAGATREQRGRVAYCWHMGVETPIDWCPPPGLLRRG
ncbi:SMI1/KNR4 family protein [Kitasatospora cineracea]|uniref:SMI1/KNR4 family protein n=1 Tax=Kitasatospora cineracea TaxID=88074 RepID=UPI0033F8F908